MLQWNSSPHGFRHGYPAWLLNQGCNVYGMALECHTKQWYVFPNACGSVVEEFGEPPEGSSAAVTREGRNLNDCRHFAA